MSYFISYDLNNPGQNYDDLIEAIKKYGASPIHRQTFIKNFVD